MSAQAASASSGPLKTKIKESQCNQDATAGAMVVPDPFLYQYSSLRDRLGTSGWDSWSKKKHEGNSGWPTSQNDSPQILFLQTAL